MPDFSLPTDPSWPYHHSGELLRFLGRAQTISFTYSAAIQLFCLLRPIVSTGDRLDLDSSEAQILESIRTAVWPRAQQNTFEGLLRMLREGLITRTCDAFEYYMATMAERLNRERSEVMPNAASFSMLSLKGRFDQLDGNDPWIDRQSDSFRAFNEFVEVRHLIVHSGGRVTPQFLTRTGRTAPLPGETFDLGDGYSTEGATQLVGYLMAFDEALVGRFGIAPLTDAEYNEILNGEDFGHVP